MVDTPTNGGETINPEAPSNNATPTATPQVNAVDTAEVERLRKEAEQARMRANQLENEMKKIAEEKEAEKLKQLEEQNEWKTVAEQTKARLEAFEKEKEAEQRSKELSQATNSVLAEFPEAVQEIAKETGLGVTEASEEAQAAFKAKLQKIADQLPQAKPSANNPSPQSSATQNDLLVRMANGDREARQQAISQIPAVQEMKRMAGMR